MSTAACALLLWPACGGETLGLPTCVAAPGPGAETSLEDALNAEVREHAFAVSCGVDASNLGTAAEPCALTASTCAQWLSCASGDHCPDYCADHRGLSCDGDRAIKCDYEPTAKSYGSVFEDCGAEGMHCVAGACTTGIACTTTAPTVHCNGTRIETCDGTLYSRDCGPTETCIEGNIQGLQFAGCVPPDQTCSPSLPTCDGNTMHACFFGESISLDCSAPPWSGTCESVQGGNTCVAAPGPCTDGDADHCNGNTLEHCMLNQWRPVDCASIGFASCTAGVCTK